MNPTTAMDITLNQLVPVLQLAIGPVILISGVGLLLLSFTNRLGRLIDRRAGILRQVIGLAALTVLLVSVLILVLFVSALFHLELGVLIVGLFALGVLALIGSVIGFLREITLSLEAVRLETRGGA